MDKLKRIIDKIENESFSTENKYWIDESWLKELKSLVEEKWEPQKRSTTCAIINWDGSISFQSHSVDSVRLYGNEWETDALAETARDMNKRNQLILQAKHEMGYGDGKWVIEQGMKTMKWAVTAAITRQNSELTFETPEQAEKIISMVGLND